MSSTRQELHLELEQQRKQVDVENYDLTLGELFRMAQTKELIRAPEYQRKFRWSAGDESYLVESLFLGLPVPSIFVASNPDGTWEVVDGLQRISTLIHFMSETPDLLIELPRDAPLRLERLQKLPSFNGLTYAELPTPLKFHFNKRGLRVTALSDKSDPEIRFEVFERLNRGGVTLTPQEVRACIYRGPFSDLLRELSADPIFVRLVKLQSVHQDDGTREELVLKFFAYLEDGQRYDGNVTGFLNRFMKENARTFDVAAGRVFFRRVINRLVELTNGPVLRSGYGLTPLNQMEAILVGAGKLLREDRPIVSPRQDWLNDRALVKSSTKGTNTRSAFRSRNQRAEELLSGIN